MDFDNMTQQERIAALKETVDNMQKALAHLETLEVEHVSMGAYRNLVQSFINLANMLAKQFEDSQKDIAYIKELQDQLQALMPTRNAALN